MRPVDSGIHHGTLGEHSMTTIRSLIIALFAALTLSLASGCTGAACRIGGESCQSNNDCCSGNTCVAGFCVGAGGSSCHAQAEGCTQNSDCCGAGQCVALFCGANSCQAAGQGCTTNSQCCGGTCNTSTGFCQ